MFTKWQKWKHTKISQRGNSDNEKHGDATLEPWVVWNLLFVHLS